MNRPPEDYARQDSLDFDRKSAHKPKDPPPVCQCCGAKLVKYRHHLSKGLAIALIRLYRHGSPARLRDLALSFPQATNAQKLRYWGLVEQVEIDETRTGKWAITALGEAFVRNLSRVPRTVITYRGVPQGTEGEAVLISEVVDRYSWRVDYAAEAEQV